MTKQDSGFKGRMDDCLFTIVEEPRVSAPTKRPTGKSTPPEKTPPINT